MAQQQQQHSSHVPKFGNWDNDNIPYTTFFENARKDRAGIRINPNDPAENPEAFMFGTDGGSEIDGGDKWVPMEEHHVRGHRRESSRGSVTSKSGSDKSSSDYMRRQQSHQQQPISEHNRKGPGHTRQPCGNQTSNESQHKRAVSIPKFGAWDEADPTSGEGFTVIFNKVKAEKQIASSTFPTVVPPQPISSFPTQRKKKSSKICCCCLFSK